MTRNSNHQVTEIPERKKTTNEKEQYLKKKNRQIHHVTKLD